MWHRDCVQQLGTCYIEDVGSEIYQILFMWRIVEKNASLMKALQM